MLGVLGGRVGGRRSEQGIRQSKCLGPPFLVAKTCVFPRAVCPDEALGSCGPSRNGLRPSSGQRPMSLREEKGATRTICPHTHLPRDAGRGPWPCLPGPLAASLLNPGIPDLSFVPGTPGALSLRFPSWSCFYPRAHLSLPQQLGWFPRARRDPSPSSWPDSTGAGWGGGRRADCSVFTGHLRPWGHSSALGWCCQLLWREVSLTGALWGVGSWSSESESLPLRLRGTLGQG